MTDHLILHHHWSSVCSQKVRFALCEKALPWDSRHVDLFRFENWQPEYCKLNPMGVVPTLEHAGRTIIESNVILEYFEDSFPAASLRPAEAHERARMRLWMKAADEIAHPSVVEASYNIRHRPRLARYSRAELESFARRHPDPVLGQAWLRKFRGGVSAEREAASYRNLERLMDRLEAQLAATPWLAGQTFSLADIALAPYVNRIEVLAHPEMLRAEARPRLADWWRRIQERDGFREAFSFANPDPSDPIAR